MHEKMQTKNKVNDREPGNEGIDILATMSAPNDSINNEWQCKTCTLINDNSTTHCQACNNPRDGQDTYNDIQKLVLSLMNRGVSQVTFFTSVNINLYFIV